MPTGTVKFFNGDKGFGFITAKTEELTCLYTCLLWSAAAR